VNAVLVEPDELAALLGSAAPPVVVDVRWTLGGPSGRPDYEQAHIPGARWIDLEAELSGPPGEGGRHPLPAAEDFQAAMRTLGVDQESSVVVYDAANSLAASRLWWLLTDAGHRHVRVLNGGLAAWLAAGLPTGSGSPPAVRAGDFVARPGSRRQVAAAEIAARLGTPDAPVLVDVRAAERFSGETEPIDPVAGHIPGAQNLPSMDNVDVSGRFDDPAAIVDRYAAVGATDDAVLYCGSGITAAHSLLALESAGLTAAIYPGSWSDWIRDPERPVATGSGSREGGASGGASARRT
jgi:thiosulfate/3-mercaptopyruvate sulfurtransferase